MQQLLLSQYEGVKSSRQALIGYCTGISNEDLFKPIDIFNNSSVAGLMVHVGNSYIHWIKNFGMDRDAPFHNSADIQTIGDIALIYEEVNQAITDFLHLYSADYELAISKIPLRKNVLITVTPLQLFTHVITHEFHHKGQILTMSRLLGYTPIDTDVIRY